MPRRGEREELSVRNSPAPASASTTKSLTGKEKGEGSYQPPAFRLNRLRSISQKKKKRRWTPETPLKKNLSSDPSPLALRPRRKCVHHVRRQSTQWRDWLPTTRSSIQHVSAASTATPNSALGPLQLFKASFTANPTSSSFSKAKGTTTRVSDASSTKSSGPPRSQII